MALLAIQGMAMSTTAALSSHHHGAVSSSVFTSSYALATAAAAAAFPRARATLAVGALTSATVTPVLDGKSSNHPPHFLLV
jgi:30S ribosomal protein S31